MTKDHAAVELPEPELFSIPSANLFPVYIGSELFSESEKRAFLDDVIALYERTGKISGQDRILGYDFGMFLYALCETGHPLRDEVYERMSTAGRAVAAAVRGRAASISRRRSVMPDNAEVAVPGFGQCTLRRFRFTASVGNRAGLRTRFPVRSAAFQRRTADIRNGIDVSERAVVAASCSPAGLSLISGCLRNSC